MRTSFPLGSGETQKGSTWKCCLSTLLHVWTRCPEASRFSISIHEQGRRTGGSLGCRKTDRPQAGGPLGFVVRCICHAPPARGVFQAAVGSGCHSSTAPPPRGEGWRVPQGSPASPWEGVSKFHYPPRCRRARPATAGSKVRVDRSVRSLFTSLELPSWRRAFCRYSRGFCAWNTVYSVVGGKGLSLLTYQAGYKHNSQADSANSQKILSVFIIWKGRDANGTNYQKISSK